MVAEDLVSIGFPLVGKVAREFSDKLPSGTTLDDLCSLGAEELMRANNSFDPAAGKPWLGYLCKWLRYAYRSFLREARKRASRHVPLDHETADGDRLPRVDPKAETPLGRAERREGRANARRSLTAAALKAAAPPADEVARRAAEVRDAVNAAVSPADLGRLMGAMLAKGLSGDVGAAKLLAQVYGLGPAPTPQQQAVQVNLNCPLADDDE